MYLIKFMFTICVLFSLPTTTDCQYDDPNCWYDDFIYTQLTCTNVTDFPKLKPGSDVQNVEIVKFEGGDITTIYNDSLPSGIIYLLFDGHPLINISADAFQASVNTLKQVYITGAKFTSLPTALLSLNKLTNLTLADTPIQYWNSTILEHIAITLKYISLRNVGLIQWPSWFSYFHSLFAIYITRNTLTSIPEDAFNSSQDTLERISFESSGLTEVPKALSILKVLSVLDLSGNNIIDIESHPGIDKLSLYPCANTLTNLTIASIGLTVLPDLSKLTKLWTVNLSNNTISTSASGLFPSSLKNLQLQSNYLPSVPHIIANMSSLYFLNLSYNYITNISFDMFPTNLDYLDLSYNEIVTITDTLLSNSSNLETLKLQSNPITVITPLAFKSLDQLSQLNLDNTNLTQVPIAFASLTNLSTLSMANTRLECDCPAPEGIYQWWRDTGMFRPERYCGPGRNGTFFLSWPLCLGILTPPPSTTPKDNASTYALNLSCTCASLLLLLVLRLCRF